MHAGNNVYKMLGVPWPSTVSHSTEGGQGCTNVLQQSLLTCLDGLGNHVFMLKTVFTLPTYWISIMT